MTDVFRTLIVPAALTPLARALAAGLSSEGGNNMNASPSASLMQKPYMQPVWKQVLR